MILAVPQIHAWISLGHGYLFFLVFSFAWCDSGYMYCVAWWWFYGPSYLAVTCLMLVSPEEYNTKTFLGDDFFTWFDS